MAGSSAKVAKPTSRFLYGHIISTHWLTFAFALGTVATLFLSSSSLSAAPKSLPTDQGLFLVATDQLEGTGFQETVILITHYSKRGATGLTINRPTTIPLQQAFPRIQQLNQRTDPLYLGGPVSTNAIFVLMSTDHPRKNMHLIANNIYFSTANNAFKQPLAAQSRTYAGYTGWAPGQLQAEINRGDWLLVHTQPDIIFEEDPGVLWQRLIKRWSGDWI
ncbi:MAG: YqgE/AlgH family protein [Ectothiorhodospiraceae bacterium]|nr:YqgE/AlgH family protein [Ectothiorhodospiraceae bacterium]